jgi:hypothetical protein
LVDAEQVCGLRPIQRPGPSQSKACRQRHRGEQDGARAIAVWLTQHQSVIAIAAQDIRQARRLSRQRPNVIRDNRLAVLHGVTHRSSIAFSSEVDSGSREENASKQEF